LTPEEISRLDKFRREERKTFPELNATMQNPFTWQVLKRAIEGRPVWELNHGHIVAWIEQNLSAGLPAGSSEGRAEHGNEKL